MDLDSVLNAIESFFDSSNVWFSVSSFAIAIVGLLYSLFRDIYQNKKKRPTYWIKTTHLVRDSIKDIKGIQILYNNEEIPNISSTLFVFYNSGKDAIKSIDVASKNPIKITISEDYRILDAFIEKQTNTDNNYVIQLLEDHQSVLLSFEFMEYFDGVTIRLIHTAPNSDCFRITGKVVAGESVTRLVSNDPFFWNRLFNIRFHTESSLSKNYNYPYRLFFFCIGIIIMIGAYKVSAEGSIFLMVMKYILFFLGIVYVCISIFNTRRKIPAELET